VNYPTREIHTHPLVPVTQNPTHTHVNSSKRVHDSTRKAQKKIILKGKTGRKKKPYRIEF
jgi:hypothetical protein